ncbi:MAG: type II toxin-antitoxin system PemK/MazF family toxin [Thermoleophilia bacterium]
MRAYGYVSVSKAGAFGRALFVEEWMKPLDGEVVVVQGGSFNRSRIATVACVALTSNLRWADAPGNVLLSSKATGLPKDSVANVSQIVTLDRGSLTERVGVLPDKKLELVLIGIDVVLGR